MQVVATSDEELMAQVKADNLDQMVPLFERYQGPLFGFLCRLSGGDAEVGQDLTQNVFYRAMKYRASYQPGQPVKAWLYQLARHVHADHWQQNRRRQATTDLDSVERTASHGRAAQANCQSVDQKQALQEALNLLPAEQREILVLHRFQGFDYAEIGEMIGCTAGAARVKAHRALEALRKIYFN
ncbi:RNA polymerase sigma factor [Hymenobacter sp. BT186]|uniref:RNA polymerase sigma factor n=1 Tax=Hymenobacter telluris TaxID=2816474 RepID=A0A939JED8_9BACT|nr:RNA polymerase sigma factor [Hymenobacter telluris]MBO0359277.1 RNA polymerase sigma factor [Hymenobacter telluris]MBW3375303.1 RNA polymerase sigma factor [Hymenobacter norwichensis]